MNKKIISAFLTIILLLSTNSCVGFKHNNLPKINQKNFKFSLEKKIKIFSQWNSYSKFISNIALENNVKDRFNNIVTLSNCCEITQNPQDADITLKGNIYDENNYTINQTTSIITGITLYLIPSWINTKEHIVIEVNNGKKTISYDLQDSMTIIKWLPLIIAMPFSENPLTISDQILTNTLKVLLLKMKDDGFLK